MYLCNFLDQFSPPILSSLLYLLYHSYTYSSPSPLNTFAILNPSTIFITISWHCPFALQIIIIIVLTAEQHNNNNNEILPKNIKERSSNFQACEPEKMRHLRDLYIYFIIPQFSTYLPTFLPPFQCPNSSSIRSIPTCLGLSVAAAAVFFWHSTWSDIIISSSTWPPTYLPISTHQGPSSPLPCCAHLKLQRLNRLLCNILFFYYHRSALNCRCCCCCWLPSSSAATSRSDPLTLSTSSIILPGGGSSRSSSFVYITHAIAHLFALTDSKPPQLNV